MTQKIKEELSAITDLKVNQINNWRYERIADAEILSRVQLIVEHIREYAVHPSNPVQENDILDWMRSFRDASRYHSIFLFDTKGRMLLAVPERKKKIGSVAEGLVLESLRTKKILLSDFHTSDVAEYPHLDMAAPVMSSRRNVPVGILLFRIDPADYFYPLIQSWPTPSETAETLLFRIEGKNILYLNQLRHSKAAPLALKGPLTKERLQAAMASRDRTTLIETNDYRNVPVLAAVRAIADTPWFLVAKTDIEEVYAPIRERAWFITVVIGILILAAGISLNMWWRKKNFEFLQQQFKMEYERQSLLKRYDYLSKYANDIILLVDETGSIAEANDRAVVSYGYSRDELFRMTIRDIRAPECMDDLESMFRKVKEQNGHMFETKHRRKDRSIFPVEISSRAVELGGKILYQSIIRDITERKEAEAALVREKNRSEAIIAAMGDGISIQDRDFRVLYQNERHREMSRGSHIGKFCYQAYVNGDRICEGCPILESYKDGKVHSVEKTVTIDGESHHFEIMSSPLRDAEGTVAAGIEAVRDITGRKQMEQSLEDSEKRYKLLVQSITDYIYTVKVEHGRPVKTIHGPGCLSVTGYSSEEFDADTSLWYQIIHGDDRAAVLDHANRILSGEPVTAFEHRIYHKNGSVHWIRNTPVPRFNGDGKLIDYDGLISNITPLKQMEAQLRQAQKMEAVGQLAGGIAHDFNNILTAIIGYANLLKMKLPELPALRSYAEQILASADRAANLTHSLLAFSRKQIIDLKPIDLNMVIRRVEKLLIRLIGEDVELKTKLAANDLQVLADSVQIEQILMNLSTNARDAMPDGGLLMIETSVFEMGEEFQRSFGYGKQGTYAAITISDTGMGMNEKTRLKIFDPFFTTKEVGKGTGLGLAMVYGIVKQHNGYINVASEPSRGATFTVYFPLIQHREIPEKAELSAIAAKGNETILLAEDNPEVRNLVITVLEESGYAVISAMDGEEAVRKFQENAGRVDMLILDIIMPKKNGKEAYQEIKQMKPGIKTLFTSGYTAEVVQRKGILEAGLDFILKPISPADLLNKVRAVLDKK